MSYSLILKQKEYDACRISYVNGRFWVDIYCIKGAEQQNTGVFQNIYRDLEFLGLLRIIAFRNSRLHTVVRYIVLPKLALNEDEHHAVLVCSSKEFAIRPTFAN